MSRRGRLPSCDRPRRAAASFVSAATALALLTGVSGCSDHSGDFVTRSGRSFEVGGEPFRFVGFNLYDGAASDIYSCHPGTRLSDGRLASLLGYIHDKAGATVVRFWAYQTYTAGGTNFSGMDRFITAARKAGLRVLPVLEDGPGNCTTGVDGVPKTAHQGDTWYTQGYKHPYGNATLSYRDYVARVAAHYRNEPTILGWMMMNEAETATRNQGDHSALMDFALDIGHVLKAADPRHLLTLGTQANGAPGASGRDFVDVYGQSVLDFTEVHDWARYGSDTDPLPGRVNGALPDPLSGQCQSTTAPIACSFAISKQLNKPLLVGEAGINATDATSRTRRAGLLGAKADTAFAAGAGGYLVWQLNTAPTDGYDVIPSQNDPLIRDLAATAERLAR